jgi:FKBP-type peptidyl-prolyl cis-trans isomerase
MEDYMKKMALPLAIAGLVALTACNQQAPTESAAPAAAAEVALDTTDKRLSYGIAYSLGVRMTQDSIPLDNDAFMAGVSDALTGGEGKMTAEEIQAEMAAYQEKAQAEMEATQAVSSTANAAAGAAFLAENGTREGVVITESGLQYEIIEAGDGAKPDASDTVEVHYTGTLVDGTVFDSSHQRGQTVSFGVGQVIPGWTEALQLMSVGSKWKVFIPSELGYGEGGAGAAIGPNSALIFEVELISIPSQEQAAAAEAAAAG